MTNDPQNMNFDELGHLSKALANISVPAGPDSEFHQNLLAQLTNEKKSAASLKTPPNHGARTMRRFLGIAATLMIATLTGWIVMQMNAHPQRAFAAMVQQFQSIRTATFITQFEIAGQPTFESKVTLLEPAWMRQEMEIQGVEMAQIMDLSKGKSLSLLPKEKKAILVETSGLPNQGNQKHIIDEFRKLPADSATFVARETIDGVSTLKYNVDQQGNYSTVWLDPRTELPIKIEMTDTTSDEKVNGRITMTGFDWDPKIDESAFSLEPPEGYKLEQQSIDVSDSKMEHFISLMQFVVRLNDDQFLDEFNTMSLVSTMQQQLMKSEGTKKEREKAAKEKLAYALDKPEITKMDLKERMKVGMQLQQSFGQGAIFYQQLLEKNHWHYQGKGIKLGESEKIVAWWHPKAEKAEADTDLETAHVLYGDLQVKAMPVADLPRMETPADQ